MSNWLIIDIVGVVFYTSVAIQLLYLLFIFSRNLFIRPKNQLKSFNSPISVVVCARNELKNLQENLPKLFEQNYPDFEVIVVNDRSWDATADYLEQAQLTYKSLKVVTVPESDMNPFAGKKLAKTLGVKGASHEHILFTDADCVPSSPNWINEMVKHFTKANVLAGLSPLKGGKGFWAFLSRFDSYLIAYHYLSFGLAKLPYMAVARNMGTTKTAFFSVKGFKAHYNIPSGDDDLFIRDIKQKEAIAFIAHSAALTFSRPKEHLKDWIKQKKRHFLTAPKYSFFNKLLLGLYSLSYVFLLLSFAYLSTVSFISVVMISLFVLRFLLYLGFAYRPFSIMKVQNQWFLVPFMELMLFLVNGLIYFSNTIAKPSKW